MEEPPDLALWTSKPPPSSKLRESSQQEISSDSDVQHPEHSPPLSEDSSEADGIAYDGTPLHTFRRTQGTEDIDTSDADSLEDVLPQLQRGFYIDVPYMPESERQAYEFLPGHDSVDTILSEAKGGRYIVRLKSGDKQMVSRIPASSPITIRISRIEATFPRLHE